MLSLVVVNNLVGKRLGFVQFWFNCKEEFVTRK